MVGIALLGLVVVFSARADDQVTATVEGLRAEANAALIDLYGDSAAPPDLSGLEQAWRVLPGVLHASTLSAVPQLRFQGLDRAGVAATAATVRACLQHVAALELLEAQREGNVPQGQTWRALISLPRFADSADGALLLQQPADRLRDPAVGRVLAREYLSWQVMRVRDLLDALQQGAASGDADLPFLRQHAAEIQTLTSFPEGLLRAAGLPAAATPPVLPELAPPFDGDQVTRSLAAYRSQVETALPSLLTDADVHRFERLLMRFVRLVPKEYRNGVVDRTVLIPLEHREATQFAEQAQTLTHELAPVWRRTEADAYREAYPALADNLAQLRREVAAVATVETIDRRASEIAGLLGAKFGLDARLRGDKEQVIEETALEARSNLNNSLAAALSDQWEEAERSRLEAYTAFDTEIEARLLPRNPDLALQAERSFLDGSGEPGIKALLDRRAPVEELTAGYDRTLRKLDESVALLRVAVSPAMIGYTAFTIIAREGMEAVIILAALLAGLRGVENIVVRRRVMGGAGLALGATCITFVLSRTLIRSLTQYGERLEAVVSVLAVGVLFVVTNWVFHKFYWVGWNAKLRQLTRASADARTREWEALALLGVGFLTVYREGFETTLFLQSLWLEGGSAALWVGIGAGALFIAVVGALIFRFGVKLPYRRMLVITGVLVVSILVSFLGSTVRLFQTVGWLPVHPVPGLTLPNWVGLWLGLYPSWEGLLIPPCALVYVGGAWLYTKLRARRVQQSMPERASALSVAS